MSLIVTTVKVWIITTAVTLGMERVPGATMTQINVSEIIVTCAILVSNKLQ